MTAVEGWFSDKIVMQGDIKVAESLSPSTLELMSQNIAINRSCVVRFKDEEVRNGPTRAMVEIAKPPLAPLAALSSP